ncbi:MAG: hypothetical protein H0W50_04005 [Parachlamydiaceae bacterium]|nr:hypothetical protein [Parachlamydiaceae bacterium]
MKQGRVPKQSSHFLWHSTLLLLVATLFTFSSCGYRPGYGKNSSRFMTLSVPYVYGDEDGDLTNAIVHEIVTCSPFEHRTENGQLALIVKLIGVEDDNIGFRYEHVHGKKYKRSIIPAETRSIAKAEVSLVNATTMCSVIPTVILSASIDFDHEYNATRHDSNVFSLGQLSDADSAFAAARHPLNRRLAQKIVEYITISAEVISEENPTSASDEPLSLGK